MTDLSIAALVSRDLLHGGPTDLDINDGTTYLLGTRIMDGQVTWERTQVKGPWTDGDFTVNRRRGNVIDTVTVWVNGQSQAALSGNISQLITAFSQDTFTLSIAMGGAQYAWTCEAADYSVAMEHANVINKKVLVTFSVPRYPVPIVGAF